MNSSRFSYYLRSRLPGGPKTPAAIGTMFLKTLDSLSQIGPVLDEWDVVDLQRSSSSPLGSTRPRISTLIESNVYREDRGDARPDKGYSVGAITETPLDSRRMHLLVMNAGGKSEGDLKLEAGHIGVPPDPAVVTYPIFKAALLAINSLWSPGWSNVCAFELDYQKAPIVPGAPLFPYSVFHMSWFAYLSAPRTEGVRLPADIRTERTPDGGLLMIAVEERLDPTNPEHLRRSRILAETMIAHAGEKDP